MQALLFHDAVDHGDIQRHDWNRGTRLGNDRLKYGNIGTAACLFQLGINRSRGAIKVFFRFTQRTVPVNRPGNFSTDIAKRHATRAFRQHTRIVQGAHP